MCVLLRLKKKHAMQYALNNANLYIHLIEPILVPRCCLNELQHFKFSTKLFEDHKKFD